MPICSAEKFPGSLSCWTGHRNGFGGISRHMTESVSPRRRFCPHGRVARRIDRLLANPQIRKRWLDAPNARRSLLWRLLPRLRYSRQLLGMIASVRSRRRGAPWQARRSPDDEAPRPPKELDMPSSPDAPVRDKTYEDALEDSRPSAVRRGASSSGGPLSPLGVFAALLVAVVIGAIVYVVSDSLTKSYHASGTFRVTVPNQQGINDTVVTAANDLATQYVQLVSSAPVVDRAAKRLGVAPSSLNGSITASTVAAQNIVQVTASSHSPSIASARASAATYALVHYIETINSGQAVQYSHTINRSLIPLNRQIASLTAQISAAQAKPSAANNAKVVNDQTVLSSLLAQRQQTAQQLATNAAGGQPTIQLVSPGGTASIAYPKPSLYAVIGFIIALLITLRIAFLLTVARRRRARAPA